TSATPSRSKIASSSWRSSSKLNPYWKPEQPPPETARRRNASGTFSCTLSSAIRLAALSVSEMLGPVVVPPSGMGRARCNSGGLNVGARVRLSNQRLRCQRGRARVACRRMSKPALAPYATHPEESRGRRHREPESPTRSVFQRDRDRIIHSTAFRRLEYKTQVFVNHEGDHYRTRLTHSLEVAQIARSVSRALGLNEDLAEAVALAHDLGHTPFGHAGEEALDEAMRPFGGFEHNDQTLRILPRLERRYAEFDGLNLTWEALEGTVKHNGPLAGPIPPSVAEYDRQHPLDLHTF